MKNHCWNKVENDDLRVFEAHVLLPESKRVQNQLKIVLLILMTILYYEKPINDMYNHVIKNKYDRFSLKKKKKKFKP